MIAAGVFGVLTFGATAALAVDDTWQLVFEDDFERAEVGDDWGVGPAASIQDGQLRLEGVVQALITRSFAPDVRLEFEAESLPGVKPCDLSAVLSCSHDFLRGYLFGFGSQGNRVNHLRGPGVRLADSDPPFLIEAGKRYHLVAVKEGKHLTYTVNGHTILDTYTDDPVGGAGFDKVGLLTWTGMLVDNVRVYERKTRHPDTPLTLSKLPDAPLYIDGTTVKVRDDVNDSTVGKAVAALNAGGATEAIRLFREVADPFTALLGEAYAYGSLHYQQRLYATEFVDLADRFAQLADAHPDDQRIADYALATQWFSNLKMRREDLAWVCVHRLTHLGVDNNPFYDKARLYWVRYLYWGALEGGERGMLKQAVDGAKELLEAWPEHVIIRQYAGDAIPWGDEYIADTDRHPGWAAHLRESYARAIVLMEKFIDARQSSDGQLGSGYGDDVEMLRTWTQVAAISTAAEKARAGIEKLTEGVWQNVLLKGYADDLTDVEHSSEPSADSLPGMLLLRWGDPLWVERNLESCHTIKNYYMGIDDNGYPRFRSSTFGQLKIGDPGLAGGDTGYHARAMKHFLWAAWQGNPEARDWFVGWAEGWRAATMVQNGEKLKGFPPMTLWYPGGDIYPPIEGATWAERKINRWARPDMTHDVFLAAYHFTGDRKLLEPFREAMRLASLGPLPKGNFRVGSVEWQLQFNAHLPNNMGTEQTKTGVYRWLTGDRTYDEYALRTAPSSLRFQIQGDLDHYLNAFEGLAKSLRTNEELRTSEVMANDRAGVAGALPLFGAYTGAISGLRDAALQTFSVTYDTPSINFAALLMYASEERLRVWLYHFEAGSMPIGLQLWRLQPGRYALNQGEQLPAENSEPHRYAWESPQEIEVLHRGTGPTIDVPPGKVWVVDLQLAEPIDVPELAPDLAVMPRDVVQRGDKLDVTVHNIGSGAAKRFAVIVEQRVGGTWKRCDLWEGKDFPAPTELESSTMTKTLDAPDFGKGAVRIRVETDGYELLETNNLCKVQSR